MELHYLFAMVLLAAGRRGDLAPWFAMGLMVLTVVPLILILVAASRREKRRTIALQQVADSLGFEFFAKENAAYLKSLKNLGVFSRIGRRQKILNLMRGTSSNIEVTIFDHNYVISAGEHSHTRRQSIICFQSDSFSFPDFTLGPKKMWDRLSGILVRQNIDFDTHPIFSGSYVLRGEDVDAVRKIFNPTVIDYFESHPGYSAEASANRLIFYRAAKRVLPGETAIFLEEGLRVLSLLHSG